MAVMGGVCLDVCLDRLVMAAVALVMSVVVTVETSPLLFDQSYGRVRSVGTSTQERRKKEERVPTTGTSVVS